MTVKMRDDGREQDFEYYHDLQLADTLKYILEGIFLCIIEEQCS